MLFTSLLFAAFFLLVYIVYWSIPNQKGKEIWLLLASIVFYGSWSFGFLFHFLGMIAINYYFIRILYDNQSKKIITLAVIINLINLGIFKYFYFFTDIFASLSGIAALADLKKSTTFKIILPLAISFYTFQMLAYIIDVYRKKVSEKISLFDFTIFILFFPQLIAGPIMRSQDFLPELRNIKAKREYLTPGLSFLALGILKKVLLADNLALLIDPVWSNPAKYEWTTLLLAAHAFSWQIYCDFSGYTDIARGC
ncbi:MAG TPA: MBOAT family O-acyltransferase, partial [Leptospiraceae bacterium]|nr:MBOAT family O-acyltransferase [Leptospiraceae bacterium]